MYTAALSTRRMQAELEVAQSSRAGNQAQLQHTRAVVFLRDEAELRLCPVGRRVEEESRVPVVGAEAARFSFQLIAGLRLKSIQPQRISCCNSSYFVRRTQ